MDTLDAILTRRSIRKYKPAPIPRDIIATVLKAAMAAPSAGNEQPWQFVVLDNRELLNAIPGFHPFAKMLLEAPTAILICGDLTKEKWPGCWIQDCSAATQNMLLAIHALGYGSVWLEIATEESRIEGMRNLLKLPMNIIPFAVVPIGVPAEELPAADRYKPERIHINKW